MYLKLHATSLAYLVCSLQNMSTNMYIYYRKWAISL